MRKVIALLSIMVVFVLLVSPWFHLSPPPVTAQESGGHRVFMPLVARNSPPETPTAIVRLSKEAYRQVAGLLQPVLLIDYGSFIWLGLSEADLAALSESGVDFQPQPLAQELFLARFQFDPRREQPDLPASLRATATPGEAGFYLVQFVGPTKDTWLDRLRGAGATVIQYQPRHAYIVHMTPAQAARLAGEPFVRWVGPYHTAYRIAPSLPLLAEHAGPPHLIENVDITLFDDGQVGRTLAAIQRLGGRFIQRFPAARDGSLVSAIYALPSDAVVQVARLGNVLWMNYLSPEAGYDDEVSDQIVVGNHAAGIPFTGYNAWLTNHGVDGTGVTVALVDSGLDTNNSATAHRDIRGRIAAFVPYTGAPATDTDGHGTHVGGIIAGNASLGTTDDDGFLYGLGVAPGAQLVVQNATAGTNWPPTGGWQQLTEDSVRNGAVASNNSWWTTEGVGVGYTAATRLHDIAVRDAISDTTTVAEPLIMVFSSGNSGPGASTITEPKEAKNIIVVGASENLRDDDWVDDTMGCGDPDDIDDMAAFSSRGPARDGRILPNIVAPGTFIASLRSATGSYGGGFCSGTIDDDYAWMTGTSQAAPHVAGGVALITQWWRTFNAGANPSPAMAKALLINGAVDIDTPDIPNNDEGWGRMNLDNVISPTVPVIYMDQTTTFSATGQTLPLRVIPVDPAQPLKVTLTWSDAPGVGSGGTTVALQNDLDLTVGQGATTYNGNNFAAGWSVPGGVADNLNNIENVYIQSPAGSYDITITAANVVSDGVPLNDDSTDQDFALVCFNCEEVADLVIAKADMPDPVVAGTRLSYTLAITNDGTADATSVRVTDTLPSGVTLASADPLPDSGPDPLVWELSELPNGDTATIIVVVDVDANLVYNNGSPVTITNQASVASAMVQDPDLSNNRVAEDTLVVAEADLEIVSFEVVDPPDQILLGQPVEITLRKLITNHGPSAPMDVHLHKTATAPPDSTVTPTDSTATELALGLDEPRTVDEVFTIECGAPSHHTFTFTNEIQPLHPDDSDPDPANNTASLELDLECVVPVIINIKPGSDPNSINPRSQDVVPIAVLSTLAGEYGTPLDFDATTIDPLSVRFGPRDEVWAETSGAFEAHGQGHVEDSLELDEHTRDGDLDLVLHFHVQETGIGAGHAEACAKGHWIDAEGGVHTFFGCDAVRIPPSGGR